MSPTRVSRRAARDPERPEFVILPEGETSDGQERVRSRAAYDLQVLATAHSVSCGHPGFVPDDYLEHLDGLAIETTVTAVELCATGLWERVREARFYARMATPMVVTPLCAVCQVPSARIELVAPGDLPAEWEHWGAGSGAPSCGTARQDDGS